MAAMGVIRRLNVSRLAKNTLRVEGECPGNGLVTMIKLQGPINLTGSKSIGAEEKNFRFGARQD